MRRALAIAWLLVFCAEAQAAPLFLRPIQDLSFGELAIFTPGAPGFIDVNAASGAVAIQNAAAIVQPARGSFIVEGDPGVPIVFSMLAGTPICDVTYINPCTGAPAISVTHTFTGQVTGTFCPQKKKCQDTINVGGRFQFTGIEQGRWTSTITVTANYQ